MTDYKANITELYDNIERLNKRFNILLERIETLESAQHPPLNLTTLASSDSICNSCEERIRCSHSSIARTGHIVLDCDEYMGENRND